MSDLGELGVGFSTAPNQWTVYNHNSVLKLSNPSVDNESGYVNENATGTYDQGWLLEDVPTPFVGMDALAIQLRFSWGAYDGGTATWPLLAARVMSGGTVLAAATAGGAMQTISTNITTTTITNSGVVSFSYVNTAADEAAWNAAVVEIRIERARNKGGNTNQQRVYGCSVTGEYDPGALPPTLLTPPDEASDIPGDEFTWQFNSPSGGSQGAFAFRASIESHISMIADEPSTFERYGDVSSDGRYLVYRHAFSPYIRVIDLDSNSLITPSWTSSANVNGTSMHGINFNDSSNRFAAYDGDNQVRIVDMADWTTVLRSIEVVGISGTFSAVILEDNLMAVCTGALGLDLVIHDPNTGALLADYEGVWSGVRSIALHPDKRWLLGVALDVVDGLNANVAFVLDMHDFAAAPIDLGVLSNGNIRHSSFSPDGTMAAIAFSAGDYLQVFDTSSGDPANWSLISVSAPATQLYKVSWSPDSKYLFTGYHIFDTTTWTNQSTISTNEQSFFRETGITDVYEIVLLRASSSHEVRMMVFVDGVKERWWGGADWVASETFITSPDEMLAIPPIKWEDF